MNIISAITDRFTERKKPPMQEIGVIHSKISYTWDQNPDKLVSKKGLAYLKEVGRDTHVSSCLRTRRQKLLKTQWYISPSGTGENFVFWADFVKWNIDNMAGEFLQDMAGMHRAIGYGFSISEINWHIIKSGPYAGFVGLKSLRLKPEDKIRFYSDKFGHVEKIVLNNYYGLGGVEMPINKVVHVIYGDNDENPYGDPTLSRVAFWAWLKKNEAQFWAIFSEKFGMPTAMASIPQNASDPQKAEIQSILNTLQSESGIMLPEGFDLSFLEATRKGDVGYDNFIERCNKEISKEILGQTLSSEEGKRGQGSYALGTVHAATLEDYVAFDAALLQTALNEQLIRRLISYNTDLSNAPTFMFLNEIDPLTLAQNFQSISAAIDIPKAWLYRKFAIPMPKAGEDVVTPPPSSSAIPPRGFDNNSKSVFAENNRDNIMAERDNLLNDLDVQALNDLASEMDGVFTEVVSQYKKKLDAGQAIEVPPKYSVNIGAVKQTLITSALYHYLIGKYIAGQMLSGNIDIPSPKKIRKFAEIEFQSPEDAVKYFSGLVKITKPEMEKLLELYDQRYFTVAGLIKSDVEKIFNTTVVGLEEGWNWRQFEAAVNEQKIQYTGTIFGSDMTGEPLKANHLKIIYQNNMMRAYQEGAQKMYDDPDISDEIWGYEYMAVGDDRTRPEHAALDGIRREKDDPFWAKYTPPWDHACRCDRIPVLRSQVISGEFARTEKLPKLNPESGFATRRL